MMAGRLRCRKPTAARRRASTGSSAPYWAPAPWEAPACGDACRPAGTASRGNGGICPSRLRCWSATNCPCTDAAAAPTAVSSVMFRGPDCRAYTGISPRSDLSAPEIVKGLRAGRHRPAPKAFEVWLDCLASCFAQLILHVNPDIIVIGGGLSRIPELYKRLPGALSRHLFGDIRPPVVAPAKYGDASGVRGAAIIGAQNAGAAAEHPCPTPP